MADKKIAEEISSLENLQVLVQTYEEIAASRMQKVKASVLNNRDFLSSLFVIYQQVKVSYKKELERIQKAKKKEKGRKGAGEQGKTVSVLLSANTGLYGDIIRRTFQTFVKGIQGKDTDIVVVGKIGRTMLDASKEKLGITSYKYFDLSDSTSNPEDFSEVISYIVEYETVIVYHGQFESILSQVPIQDTLTGELPEEESKKAEEAAYIFEPSLDKVVDFFESEILASVFEQSLHESSLSKYAARMINLDRAVVNIADNLKKAQFKGKRAHHRLINKKQIGLLSSMSLWS